MPTSVGILLLLPASSEPLTGQFLGRVARRPVKDAHAGDTEGVPFPQSRRCAIAAEVLSWRSAVVVVLLPIVANVPCVSNGTALLVATDGQLRRLAILIPA